MRKIERYNEAKLKWNLYYTFYGFVGGTSMCDDCSGGHEVQKGVTIFIIITNYKVWGLLSMFAGINCYRKWCCWWNKCLILYALREFGIMFIYSLSIIYAI